MVELLDVRDELGPSQLALRYVELSSELEGVRGEDIESAFKSLL